MSDAVASSLGIVAYLALFTIVGILFLLVNLVVGRFLRPVNPHPEKLEIYECGEPTIGSSFVQFDLRFYVVALLFIIFDVEVAFFFPWATVFGKATHLMDDRPANVVVERVEGELALTDHAAALYREMGVRNPQVPLPVPATLRSTAGQAGGELSQATAVVQQGARQFVLVTIVDIAVFFAVLLIGFAYVWKRGDLNWVRAVARERALAAGDQPPGESEVETALSA